ncbi:hypothetical protein VPH35_045147 [Triticum aestivum]
MPADSLGDVCSARTKKILEMEEFWGWALRSKALTRRTALISKHPSGSRAARVGDHVGERKCLGWSSSPRQSSKCSPTPGSSRCVDMVVAVASAVDAAPCQVERQKPGGGCRRRATSLPRLRPPRRLNPATRRRPPPRSQGLGAGLRWIPQPPLHLDARGKPKTPPAVAGVVGRRVAGAGAGHGSSMEGKWCGGLLVSGWVVETGRGEE